MLKVKDLIEKKDYDYISYHLKYNNIEDSVFVGACKSENGKLVSLDGDIIYDEDDIIFEYEEWKNEKNGIKNGLTVVVYY